MNAFWIATAGSAVAVVVVMAVAFVIGRLTGKYSVIDGIWGIGFIAVAWTALLATAGHGVPYLRWTLVGMVSVWGIRLAVHILRRNAGQPEDHRYQTMLDGAGPGRIVRKVHLPQGIVMWFVSLPVQVGMVAPTAVPVLVICGVALWAVGFAFESIGDAQLSAFRADPARRGTVLDTGLWRYTRHPNYFGDACGWWGIFLATAGHWSGWLTVASPIVMTYLLVAKTGKALTEKHLTSSRQGYADYVSRTSGFLPLPPRSTVQQGAVR